MNSLLQRDGVGYTPSLAFFQQVVHPEICTVTSTRFKVSASPSALYRVELDYKPGSGETGPRTVIVKRIAPNWQDDPHGHDREVNFYTSLYPRLELQQGRLYFAGIEPESEHRLVIVEDMGGSHRFPPPTHPWSEDEIRPILQTYARLHVRGQPYVHKVRDEGWLFPRHEERVRATADMLPEMVETVVKAGLWSLMPRFSALLERTLQEMGHLADAPITLLHGDVYPPNIGLPHDPTRHEVMLLDWEMVSWGLAEMDLAYMFCQPYRSHRFIHKAEALNYYWAERERLEGVRVSKVERAYRQRYADTVLVLWLIPVASRMALSPFPPDSPVRHFWASNFQLLNERLQALCDEP